MFSFDRTAGQPSSPAADTSTTTALARTTATTTTTGSDTHELTARFARMMTWRDERLEARRDIYGASTARRRPGARSRNCAAEKRHARRERLLQRSIDVLHEQLMELERSKTLAVSRHLMWQTNRTGVAVEICKDYFRVFANGFDSALPMSSAFNATASFIRSAATQDLVCREYKGVENLLRQWEKYTRFHGNLSLQLNSITLVDEDNDLISICGAAEMRMTILETTIEHLYPALYAEAQRDPNVKQFVASLIGKEIVTSVDKVLHFNGEGKIFAHESRVHLASGILAAIQNPMAAMKMLGASLITADGHWKMPDDNDVQDDFNEMPKEML